MLNCYKCNFANFDTGRCTRFLKPLPMACHYAEEKTEDIVIRLRDGTKLPVIQALMDEAADEIERLREELNDRKTVPV